MLQRCYFLRTYPNFFCLFICLYFLFSFLYLHLAFLVSVSFPPPPNLFFYLHSFSLLRIILCLSFRRLFYISCYLIPYLSLLVFLPRYPLSVFLFIFLFSSYVPLSFPVCRLLLLFFSLYFSARLFLSGSLQNTVCEAALICDTDVGPAVRPKAIYSCMR